MTLPPELEGPFQGARGWWGFFPTAWEKPYRLYDHVIALQPGDTYKVFWARDPITQLATKTTDTAETSETTKPAETTKNNQAPHTVDPVKTPETAKSPDTPKTQKTKKDSGTSRTILKNVIDTIRSELYFIFFTPGEYKISVLAQYWTNPERPKEDYRTVSESITVQVGAPQSVILLGAALGGLIAYLIFPQARRRFIRPESSTADGKSFFFKRLSKEGVGIFGAILLSAMVTILLSRISETQFVIRVTVNDFWGAVAIGFVANYAGTKILDKIIPEPPKTSARQKKTTLKPTKTSKKSKP